MEMGIDQLNLHSVQLGYLKILQMGNTETTQKQENKYEVKPQYEELSKQLNMQHAINQCYECMRAIKDRIARTASRLAIISIEPLYHAQQVSRWKSSVRDLQDPSAHQSSVVFRHDKSVGHHSDDSVGLFRHNKHDNSVGQSQRGSQSGHQSICQAQYGFKWVAIERATHNESSATKITQIIGGERRNKIHVVEKCYSRNHITVTSFCSQQNRSQQPVVVFSKEHQNDTVPTNSNDVAKLHQLTTDISCEATKSCLQLVEWKSSCCACVASGSRCARERMTNRRMEEPVARGMVLRLDKQLRVAILVIWNLMITVACSWWNGKAVVALVLRLAVVALVRE
ncbi:mediator-associated protein 1-like [Dorcoceras hygrometricum]|uniref:Mediator-associated protein 1-like n=1 Tax=Dorcoceras hygrometricum TaxID=472368 RepID=A0A2Z7DCJ3_9LAMI|nr:mediator-associated protein 1-like [Dorcoceras hygrometricum]